MELNPTEAVNIYLYEDRSGHRIVRRTSTLNLAKCSHCGATFGLIATLLREPGENDDMHERRAYQWKAKR